jgi:chemotaxis signal transduction protein
LSVQIAATESFVIFPLGSRRFALPTCDVVELTRTGFVHKLPHATPDLSGVLVRRGEVLPVWDVTRILLGPGREILKYWLVTRRNFAGEELTAIPVSGECQMLSAEMLPAPQGAASHVRGVLPLENQWVEVLDLARMVAPPESAGLGAAK